MRGLARKFYREPVFALAVIQAAAVASAASIKETAVTVAAGILVAICEAAKRNLVTPVEA